MKSGVIAVVIAAYAALNAQTPVELNVDASDAPRRLFHARMTMAVTPGTLKLQYPKWIPGEHAPTGPIADLAGLRVTAGAKTLPWRRDPVDMYTIAVDVPAGISKIEVAFDLISPPDADGFSSGASATTEMAVLSWNQVLLYPAGTTSDSLKVKATLKVPAGWRFGTALPVEGESGDSVSFQPASLTTMVDSPVITGRYFRTIELGSGTPKHYMHLGADSQDALNLTPETIDHYRQLVEETGTLFGARHYRSYHFLVSLSDHVAHFGLEHHESSDDRMPERALVDPEIHRVHSGLLPHEMSHSWNGKYRRPAGLATPDYQKPMEGELLWVYEGLTTYLGDILTPRSGLQSVEDFRQALARTAATLENNPGRKWRPLEDTTVGAQILYGSRRDRQNLRRGTDFYPEGSLIWLEADTIIRRESQGKRSLDDFCKAFFGGPSGPPQLKPYTFDDVVAALQGVQPHDWRKFFDERVIQIAEHAPMGGITGSGWKLVYRDTPPGELTAYERERKSIDVRFSLGLVTGDDGVIRDVIVGTPADAAGMAPGAKIMAVDGYQFNGNSLRSAIRAAKDRSEPIEFIVKDGERYKVFRAACHTGERYPDLERDAAQPDLLSEIIHSAAKK